jgi:hypothetical protein
VRRPRRSFRFYGLVGIAALTLCARGEHRTLDPALRSPGMAVASYWEAIQANDADRIASCSVWDPKRVPYPGMLWSLPAARSFTIEGLRYMPIHGDEVVVSYTVRFRPEGAEVDRVLPVMTDMVCRAGEWRVARPLAERGILSGRPQPTRVDI